MEKNFDVIYCDFDVIYCEDINTQIETELEKIKNRRKNEIKKVRNQVILLIILLIIVVTTFKVWGSSLLLSFLVVLLILIFAILHDNTIEPYNNIYDYERRKNTEFFQLNILNSIQAYQQCNILEEHCLFYENGDGEILYKYENCDHEVFEKKTVSFPTYVKTDISRLTIDLNERKILIPYYPEEAL